MNRMLIVAAATLIASSASAGTIRIPTAGKSADQVRVEVADANRRACQEAARGVTLPLEAEWACRKQLLAQAAVELRDPALADARTLRLAAR